MLIFSQSTKMLSLIERTLAESPHPDPSEADKQAAEVSAKYRRSIGEVSANGSCCWSPKHYCRLDGTTNSKRRQELCTCFNETKYEAGCCSTFLISTKAGGQVRPNHPFSIRVAHLDP